MLTEKATLHIYTQLHLVSLMQTSLRATTNDNKQQKNTPMQIDSCKPIFPLQQ